MISVILYGRNDSYGYNLHKRAVISLNCVAAVLNDPHDEIIFVDYNTPDDFPTFPEAIADTLTDRAKSLIRIFRVRPSQHERFRDMTKLVALEPVARNVGLRRSNPENRWILSTNTDMVFVPRHESSLSEIVAALPDAYYHLPRFEIPEPVWESYDRTDPAAIIEALRTDGSALHLNEIVYSEHPEIRYDAPGDFQLILRSDAWAIHGFHEAMLLGFHVDSNIAKRLSLLPRRTGDLVEAVYGYHCQHIRQLTPAHAPRATQNDVYRFHADVERADIPEQAETWGLAGEAVEELRVDTTTSSYLRAMRSVLGQPQVAPTLAHYSQALNRLDYPVDHVIPFLASIFSSYPRDCILGWIGSKPALLVAFAAAWKEMGFTEPIRVLDGASWFGPELPPHCEWTSRPRLLETSQAFVFDFGAPENPTAEGETRDRRREFVADGFRGIVQRERERLTDGSYDARRFVGVNTMAGPEIESLFKAAVGAALSPLSTRVQHGYVAKVGTLGPEKDFTIFDEVDCLSMMLIGPAGEKATVPGRGRRDAIRARPGRSGVIAYGPYVSLVPGRYEIAFELYAERPEKNTTINVDVATHRGQNVLARERVRPHKMLSQFVDALKVRQGPLTCVLGFDVGDQTLRGDERSLEFRVWAPGDIDFYLAGLRLRQVATQQEPAPDRSVVGQRAKGFDGAGNGRISADPSEDGTAIAPAHRS